MLLRENYTAEYILRLREETGADSQGSFGLPNIGT